jgi:glutamine amidotransferase
LFDFFFEGFEEPFVIAILDYRAGNLTSVERALRHIGADCEITDDHDKIRRADRIVFPGVGAAGASMENLRALGLDDMLRERLAAGIPLLGICVGLQVSLEYSEENDTQCLGFIRGRVRRFPTGMKNEAGQFLKIPHMGWNRVEFDKDHPVFRGISADSEFYFVHSYYPDPTDPGQIVGRTHYGIPFGSAVQHKNLVATQFHPEKSGPPGLAILENFCRWDGTSA